MTSKLDILKGELTRQRTMVREHERRIRLTMKDQVINWDLVLNSWVSTLEGKFEYRYNLRYEDDVILIVELYLPRGCHLPFHKHSLDNFQAEIMIVLNESRCYYSYTGEERVVMTKGAPVVVDANKLHSLDASPGARLYIIWTKI